MLKKRILLDLIIDAIVLIPSQKVHTYEYVSTQAIIGTARSVPTLEESERCLSLAVYRQSSLAPPPPLVTWEGGGYRQDGCQVAENSEK